MNPKATSLSGLCNSLAVPLICFAKVIPNPPQCHARMGQTAEVQMSVLRLLRK
jgi:hypothetical protein